MAWVTFLSGLVSLFNRFFKNQGENELRKEGARKADLARREKQDRIRKKAKTIRRNSPPASDKSDILGRM